MVSGQRILRLVAVGADSRHALGARFGDLAPSGIYRAIAWVKAEPGVRVMIEARDRSTRTREIRRITALLSLILRLVQSSIPPGT